MEHVQVNRLLLALLFVSLAVPALGEPYTIRRRPSKSVHAVMTVNITVPGVTNPFWDVFLPHPPVLERQAPMASTRPGGRTAEDASAKHALVYELTQSGGQSFTATLEIDAQLYALDLVPGRGAAVALSPQQRALCLASSRLFDFKSPALQRWLQAAGLLRKAGESDLDVARRAFLYIKQHGHYAYVAQMDRVASHVVPNCTSDCGGMEILFGSILRANGIPFRALVGRWALSETAGHPQQHVKGEFFLDGAGWVPVDLSSAVLWDKDPNGLRFFGHDSGDFIVFHVDPELEIPTRNFGVRDTDWLQGPVWWVSGSGSVAGSSTQFTWTVK